MWEIYDRLIEGIPEDLPVTSFVSGSNWTMVRSGDCCGTAMTVNGHNAIDRLPVDLNHATLKEAAVLAKSWNFRVATIGMAAINAWYNTMDHARALGHEEKDEQGKNAFDYMVENLAGKKVVMIGHFPNIERLTDGKAEVVVLERDPSGTDFPDSACEYLLPESDAVIITGSAFTNKTMPRLLELSKNAMTCVVGPTTPVSGILFDYGVDLISGFCSSDAEHTENVVRQGVRRGLFRTGTMVNCNNPGRK